MIIEHPSPRQSIHTPTNEMGIQTDPKESMIIYKPQPIYKPSPSTTKFSTFKGTSPSPSIHTLAF